MMPLLQLGMSIGAKMVCALCCLLSWLLQRVLCPDREEGPQGPWLWHSDR